jgi:hypothetical protein
MDSIPIFMGVLRENINDWLEIVSSKFEIIGYDFRQTRRFIPQYFEERHPSYLLHSLDI